MCYLDYWITGHEDDSEYEVKVLLCTGWSYLPSQGTVKTTDFQPASEMKLEKQEVRSACNISKASEGPINGNCFCESGKFEWYLLHQLKISQHSANVCAKTKIKIIIKKIKKEERSLHVFLLKDIPDCVFQGYRKSSLWSCLKFKSAPSNLIFKMQDLKVTSFSISALHWLSMQMLEMLYKMLRLEFCSIYSIMRAKCLAKALVTCTSKLAG